ncbi:hypothetical protein EJ03DRAFT_354503 [Teratosphaeria nubilosa]|uniref:Uncharacterized protein n=1 Tax=Teratosphaeria nubilosa TaxID=161662 RepID=A0A6G1KZP3_9PEZI|nr:hypothetical protein EJ03DRAFT_354503 [Teratosphaeria nubilosa]
MCPPERPSPDAYDDNTQVHGHFSKTPGLTPIPRGHFYNNKDSKRSVAFNIKCEVRRIYAKFSLERCHNHGLFFAGSPYWTQAPDRDKTMLLVVELTARDIKRWRDIDDDARRILRLYDLGGIHGKDGFSLEASALMSADAGTAELANFSAMGPLFDEPTSATQGLRLHGQIFPEWRGEVGAEENVDLSAN